MGEASIAVAIPTDSRSRVGRDRLVISAVFAVHGAVTGTWTSRIPWVQEHLHISLGVLGGSMVAATAGSLLAMPGAGAVVRRFGHRTALRLLLALWTACLALPALMPDVPAFAASLFFFGASAGLADVVMNAAGVRVERRAGKSIMSGLHGLWSVGVLAGSGLGVLCARAQIGAPAELASVAVVLTVIALILPGLLTDEPVPHEPGAVKTAPAEPKSTRRRLPRLALPGKALLGLAIVGFCAVFAEGACSNWSAVYLVTVAHTNQAIAAFAVTGFACTMAIGRLTGDAVVRRLGSVRTVRFGGAAATAGAVIVVLAGSPLVAVLGFVLTGLGIATTVPLVFAASGRATAHAESAIASIAVITYTAGLVADPTVGLLGSAISLPFAFGVVAVLASGLVFGAGALREKTPAA